MLSSILYSRLLFSQYSGAVFQITAKYFTNHNTHSGPSAIYAGRRGEPMQLRCVGFSCSCASPDYCLMHLVSICHFLFCGNNTWDKINPFSSDYLGHEWPIPFAIRRETDNYLHSHIHLWIIYSHRLT